jgi:DNA-binding SARP family transcriptional activator
MRWSSITTLARVVAGLMLVAITGLASTITGNASGVRESAIDTIGRTYSIAVESTSGQSRFPVLFSVIGAELNTVNPDESTAMAPPGMIYLWLDARSGPERGTSATNQGDYFSNMTPLPATALSFIAKSGSHYEAIRANPISQTYNPNSNSDNGLLDATYYFTVPISTRAGTIMISKSSTMGTQYTGFVGVEQLLLTVGGPTSIPVSFPKTFTVTTTMTVPQGQAPGTRGANLLNDVGLLLVLLFVAYIALKSRRHQQRRGAPPVNPPTTTKPAPATASIMRVPTPKPASESSTAGQLRVAVMGPLDIRPCRREATDPLRAFIAYLALHDDRPQSADEIQTALWPDDGNRNGVSQKTFLNYVSRARLTVGVEHLPEAQNGSGYILANATTDWREFRTLALSADQASGSEAILLRREALALVRGVPFEGDTTSFFEWSVTQKYTTSMIGGVTVVADKLQRDLVSTGDLDGAEWAVRQAMKLAPTELPLWRGLVDICDARDDRNVMNRFWAEAERDLWPKAVEELRARLIG